MNAASRIPVAVFAQATVRILVFLLTFIADVKVKAMEAVQLKEARSVMQEPKDCLTVRSLSGCAIGTRTDEKYILKQSKAAVVLDAGTSVSGTESLGPGSSKNQLSLVKGTLWIESEELFTVVTEFGSVTGAGQFWVIHEKDRVIAVASQKSVELHPRGSTETLEIPQGMENWIGKVAGDGRAETGVPQAILFEAHVNRWARLYPGKKKAFALEVKAFHEQWIQAAKETADIHRELYERKIASLNAVEERKRKSLQAAKARDAELTALFRKKSLSGE